MPQTMPGGALPSWQHFQQEAMALLPRALGSLLVLLVGILLAVVLGRVLRRLLQMTDIDRHAANAGLASSLGTIGIRSTASLMAVVLEWLVFFASTIVALYLLDARLASGLAERFLLYLPRLAGAVAILLGGIIVARFLARAVLIAAVNRDIGPSRLLADLTRVAIVATAVAIAFEQAEIGRMTVLVAFAILFGGITLAASIAVGLSLRDLVSAWVREQFGPTRSRPPRDAMHHW